MASDLKAAYVNEKDLDNKLNIVLQAQHVKCPDGYIFDEGKC